MATATKKKSVTVAEGTPVLPGAAPVYTPEQIAEFATMGRKSPLFKQGKTQADGSAWTRGEKRTSAESIVVLEAQKASAIAKHEEYIAKLDKKIAWHNGEGRTGGGGFKAIDPVAAKAAADELLAEGWTVEQITAMEKKLRLAQNAVKNNLLTPTENEAVPAFLAQ